MVYILLGTGFEETEAIAPLDLLRRAEIPVMTVGLNGKTVYGGHNIGIDTDISVGQMDLTDLDMIVLPGGLGGVASIRGSQAAMDAIRFAWENGKFVAAICAGPTVLADLHITDNNGLGDTHQMPFSARFGVNWHEVLRAWEEIGYKGLFNLEILGERVAPLPIREAKLGFIYKMCEYMLSDAFLTDGFDYSSAR